MTNTNQLVQDSLAIWLAAVEAVTPRALFGTQTSVDRQWLHLSDEVIDLTKYERIVVVGAGKASAAMAVEFERQCLSKIPHSIQVQGWINSPEGTFAADDSKRIHLHAARPAGTNLPTQLAVEGTRKILELASSCTSKDLCIVLLSGGGSALLVAPIPGISLADKQAVAKRVAAAGGNIEQLNSIRRAVSDVKGGKLARACGAGRIVTLIISDVLGDPLETIASGPTFESTQDVRELARRALEELGLDRDPALARVVEALQSKSSPSISHIDPVSAKCVSHVVLGNNATAVDAAGVKAVELGYRYAMQSSRQSEGDVAQVAHKAAAAIEQLAGQSTVNCWISGGEPTVKLPVESQCGRGGRNQQLALLTLIQLEHRKRTRTSIGRDTCFVFLSGGTDGEDGPTDAAGAWVAQDTHERSKRLGLDLEDYAARCDAYTLFEQTDGLIRTGPTGTNVCDVRVALVHHGSES